MPRFYQHHLFLYVYLHFIVGSVCSLLSVRPSYLNFTFVLQYHSVSKFQENMIQNRLDKKFRSYFVFVIWSI